MRLGLLVSAVVFLNTFGGAVEPTSKNTEVLRELIRQERVERPWWFVAVRQEPGPRDQAESDAQRPIPRGALSTLLAARRPVAIVGHRGTLQHAPENTLANFRACLNLKVGFEVDVRKSKDGKLVCIHDETVDRTTNGQGRVADLTLEQLTSLDAGSWFSPAFVGERVPTFIDVLQLVRRSPARTSALIAVDIKSEGIERDVVQAANRLGVLDRLLFIGNTIRDSQVRRRLHTVDPKAHIACLANEAKQLESALQDEHSDWVYFRYVPSRSEIVRVHRHRKRGFIAGPTVSGLESGNWRRAVYSGIDAILTDFPWKLAELLRRNRKSTRRDIPDANADTSVRKLTYGMPADVNIDPRQLANAVTLIRSAIEKGELQGAVLLVARQGRIILHEALGTRDAAREQPMQKNSLFRMASNTKPVTAVGILLLVQDGLVGLDEPVSTYLTSFAAAKAKRITIRQLLTHTSGLRIRSIFLNPLLDQTRSAESPLLQEVARFGKIGAEVQPGASYSYNNAGYNTLAGVIEAVTGSYQEHLRTRIYEPLGMRDTCNHESNADQSRMSGVFRRQADGRWETRWKPGDAPDYPFVRGSGGMITTAYDYAVFCQMLLNKGMSNGRRILSKSLVQQATNPQLEYIPAADGYGLGWIVSEHGGTFSHSGSDGTWAWVDPQREVIGLVLTQTQTKSTPRKQFRELINQACGPLTEPPVRESKGS